MKLQISTKLLETIQQHGAASYPHEGAGVLFGKVHPTYIEVQDLMPMDNTFDEAQRGRRYMIDARGMMQAELTAEGLGLDVVGIFHSHPDHPARPSQYDLAHSLPWYSYIITSVDAGAAGDSRAWRLQENRAGFDELPISIEDQEAAA